jgi:hypothetical protein
VPLGSVDYVIDSKLISGGVNQTLHRITINYNFEINCLAPFSETVIAMNNTLILAETVIVGEVPNYILSAK